MLWIKITIFKITWVFSDFFLIIFFFLSRRNCLAVPEEVKKL